MSKKKRFKDGEPQGAEKQDNSIFIPQGEKIKETFEIRPFKWTDKQKTFIDIALSKDTKIIICKAPPGVGKTLLSLYCSLVKLVEKKVSQIVYLRSPVESATRSLGYLSGDYDEKISHWAAPLYSQLEGLVSKATIDKLLKEYKIKVDSIGFIKGLTYNVSNIIVDESEDLSLQELLLVMGRLGKFSQLYIIGDEKQCNIKSSGFTTVYNLFNDQESKSRGIFTFEFTKEDCMRSELTKFIIEKFEMLGPY